MTKPLDKTETQPRVSVVIPAYNYARYLPDALKSVLEQNYPDFEIIVVNDGSTDNTEDVLQPFMDRIQYIYQANAGLSAARNTGIEAASSAYVSLLDADDRWRPGFLEKLASTICSLPEEYGLVAACRGFIDENGNPLPGKVEQHISPDGQEIMVKDILIRTRFCPSAVLIKKKCFESCGLFDTSLRSSEDRDMWIRIASKHKIYLLPEQLAQARVHGDNMSKDAERMKFSTGRVLRKAFNSDAVSKTHIFTWLQAFSFRAFQVAWMYHDSGASFKALRCMLKSIVLWPVFLHPLSLNEPLLFRLRAIGHFVRNAFRKP